MKRRRRRSCEGDDDVGRGWLGDKVNNNNDKLQKREGKKKGG